MKSKADEPAASVAGRIPRPLGSAPLPHDLPGAAWARLFAATLTRLQRAKPRWAAITAVQVDDLLASWMVFARDGSLSREERDMRLEEALEQLEGQPPWGVSPRKRSAPSRRGKKRAHKR